MTFRLFNRLLILRPVMTQAGAAAVGPLSGSPSQGSLMPATRDILEWLLDPSEPAMRYLASRDLLSPRPSERALARLQAEVPTGAWATKIFARQKAKTYWVKKRACYVPKFTATIWQLQVLADMGLSRRNEQ